MPQIKTLRAINPKYDADRWTELKALSSGGKSFHKQIRKMLPQNALEPDHIYNQRVGQAHYHSFMGSIINMYVGWLFAADFVVKPHSKAEIKAIDETDDFYGELQEDVGNETTFSAFTRERFRDALVTGKSHWLIQLPSDNGEPPADRAEWQARDLGRATLQEIENDDLLDWYCDEQGRYEWVVLYDYDTVRKSWSGDRDTVIEEWRIYDNEFVTTFHLEYPVGKKPSDNEVIEPASVAKHGFTRVPLISLHIPHQLCIGEQTRDPQIEHFRLDNALSWLARRSCYAQPVFKLEDPESTIPTMGAGYAIVVGAKDDFGWSSPPNAPFDVLQKLAEAKRDEIYRVTHTLSLSVDNNAETVGRSAASKEIDAAATRLMLQAYGTYVSKAIEETYETISEARGEPDYEWSVDGFNGYDTATVASLISNAHEARALGIPSTTFHKELTTKVAMALFAGEDQRMKEAIRQEIAKANFDLQTIAPADDLEIAKAEELRAKAKAVLTTADAATVTANAAAKGAETAAKVATSKGGEPAVGTKPKKAQKYSPEYGR